MSLACVDLFVQVNLPTKNPRYRPVGYVIRTNGCWEWTGARNQYGYGVLRWDGKNWLAHRLMYVRLVGVVDKGFELDHLCRNVGCCNPAHLEPVTHRVNILRGQAFSAINARKTHCPKGHRYAGANLVTRRGGSRRCRLCEREAGHRNYSPEKKRAANLRYRGKLPCQ